MEFVQIDKVEYECLLKQDFLNHNKYRIYHSLEWLSFIEKTQMLTSKFIKIVKENECIGLFPYFEKRVLFLKLFVFSLEGWNT